MHVALPLKDAEELLDPGACFLGQSSDFVCALPRIARAVCGAVISAVAYEAA